MPIAVACVLITLFDIVNDTAKAHATEAIQNKKHQNAIPFNHQIDFNFVDFPGIDVKSIDRLNGLMHFALPKKLQSSILSIVARNSESENEETKHDNRPTVGVAWNQTKS